jgi:hypothetical protein
MTLGVSFHEAGHAVVAVVLGRTVPYATSRPSDDAVDAAGHVRVSGMYVDDDDNDVVILLAGVVAEVQAGFVVEAWRLWKRTSDLPARSCATPSFLSVVRRTSN